MTVYGISCCICWSPNFAPVGLPTEWQFHRFLLWQFIFHSYSESSSFGRPGPDRSAPHPMVILQIPVLTAHYSEIVSFGRPGLGRCNLPPIKWQIHRLLWNSYFIPTLRAQHLADQVLVDLPPSSNGNFTDSCSTLKGHIWQTKCWQINPPCQMAISQIVCSDSSYFIPTPTAHIIWQTRSWQIYPPPMVILQILALTAQYSESLSFGWPGLGRSTSPSNSNFTDFCFTLRVHIWQTPLSNGDFTDSCEIHISFLLWDLNIWKTRSWQIYPHLSGNFTDSYSDSFYFIPTLRAQHLADQVLADPPPCQMAISQIPALTAHISWQLIFHSYSESSTFGRPGLGRCTPIWVAISLMPTLTTLISFLLWELIIWQTRSWHIYPPIQWWFHRFLLWQLTTLRAQHLADQGWSDVTPHIRWQFHRFLPYPESSYLADWVLADQPPIKGQFYRFLWNSYFIPSLRAHHLADQVLADVPPFEQQFHWFQLYSESSYLADPLSNGDFTDSCEIHISFLLWELNIWQTMSWQIYPCHLAILQISALTAHISFLLWELIIWQTTSWQIYPPIKWQF